MKMMKWVLLLVMSIAYQTSAMAKDTYWTAHVGKDGTVLRQWPKWIENVELSANANYFSQYKLILNNRIVHQDPGFCTVSPIDGSTEDRLLHGQAKVIGKPKAEGVTVLTQLVDVKGASGDNSLEFLVMCMR